MMEDDAYNDTYLYNDYDIGNLASFEVFDLYSDLPTVLYVIAWIVMLTGLPLSLLAIYALYSMVQDDHVAPVYVINLLISDVLQICCMVIWVADPRKRATSFFVSKSIYFISVMASVGFMVCVSLERYLVVAYPLWYRFRRSIKSSVLVSIVVWALCFMEFLFALLAASLTSLLHSVFLLLPFPLLIFSLAGTLKALSAAISVPLKEKRRIVAILVVVLINYSVLFLPWVIWLLKDHTFIDDSEFYLSFLQFSPLADLVLYVFMRKGVVDKLLARLCCCRMRSEEEQQQEQATNMDELNTEEVAR